MDTIEQLSKTKSLFFYVADMVRRGLEFHKKHYSNIFFNSIIFFFKLFIILFL